MFICTCTHNVDIWKLGRWKSDANENYPTFSFHFILRSLWPPHSLYVYIHILRVSWLRYVWVLERIDVSVLSFCLYERVSAWLWFVCMYVRVLVLMALVCICVLMLSSMSHVFNGSFIVSLAHSNCSSLCVWVYIYFVIRYGAGFILLCILSQSVCTDADMCHLSFDEKWVKWKKTKHENKTIYKTNRKKDIHVRSTQCVYLCSSCSNHDNFVVVPAVLM